MDAPPSPADAELAVLADVIWAQRTALEQLAFRLTALRLVLGADLRRYVGRCLDEVDAAADRLAQVEVRRVVAHAAVCRSWGRSPASLRLGDLAAQAPEPWATVFADHHDSLRALVSEVSVTSDENARLCGGTLDELRSDLTAAGAAPIAGGRGALRLVPRRRRPQGAIGVTDASRPRLGHLSALADELRRELEEALRSDRTQLVEQLRGELALLEDLALPEAVSELRLQHLTYEATATAMRRPLPAGLVRFLG